MKKRIQFGVALFAALSWASMPGVSCAQKPHGGDAPNPNRPPQHQMPAQPHPQAQNPNANRPPLNPNVKRPPTDPNVNRPPVGPGRPPGTNLNSEAGRNGFNSESGVRKGTGANFIPSRPPGAAGGRPWVDRMRDLSPQQRDRVFQNSRAFQSFSPEQQNKIRQQFNQWDHMTPQQRASLRQNEQTWRKLTPDQRDYIKNDVLPKWRQMPWDRQQAMKQKLGVLQNMPESARNQRLNDPNFTRGMSDEERSMLHDLSHLHVGGAPEPPGAE